MRKDATRHLLRFLRYLLGEKFCVRPAAGIALLGLALGCAGPDPAGNFRSIPFRSFPAKPAQFIIYPPLSRKNITDEAAVIVINQEGQNLQLVSNHLRDERRETGTLADFLATRNDSNKYILFQVASKEGKTLGHLLVYGDWVDSFFLRDDGRVFIRGKGSDGDVSSEAQ